MEKLKCIYIICFVIQLLSIPFNSYLFFSMAEAKRYKLFYCSFVDKGVDENFWKEFRKVFTNEYTDCHESPFDQIH